MEDNKGLEGLVKLNVKYRSLSMLQMEMIIFALTWVSESEDLCFSPE